MASVLTYNGVSLPFLRTEKFSQEVVYSPDGVDSIYTKVTIGVGCVLSPCLFNGVDVADWVRNVRPYLMVRGAQLFFEVDGTYLMQPTVTGGESPTYTFNCAYEPSGDEAVDSPNFTAAGGQRYTAVSDAKLGPRPVRFDVRRIEGNTWLAYYEIETWIPYCQAGSAPPFYLSNRWSTAVKVDDEYFMTRTITGTLIINGQWGNQTKFWDEGPPSFVVDGIIEDMVANSVIIPPCPKRWKREAINILRSSDGLTVNYEISDVQLYTACPTPATKIDCQYTETSGTKDFALLNMMVCEITCTVYGEANANWNPTGTINDDGTVAWNANNGLDVNKYNLMTLMFQIVLSRIPLPFLVTDDPQQIGNAGSPASSKYIIQYFQLKEDVFKPVVGCVVRALRPRLYNTQTIAKTLQTAEGAYNYTSIGSTILVEDCINDIARQPQNMLNYGTFLIAAQSLTGTPGSGVAGLTPCQLASAILYPCADTYRNINASIASSATALGATSINVSPMAYPAPGGEDADTDVITPLANTGTYYSNEQFKNPFTEYTIDVQYLTDQHMMQLPVMYDIYPIGGTPASGCVFAQTSCASTKKLCHWRAGRIGQWPPNPMPTDIIAGYGPGAADKEGPTGDQLLSYHVTFADSFLMQDGITRKYETGGVYECGLATRLQWDQPGNIPTAVNPITSDIWETTVAGSSIASASMYPTSLFVSGIVGYSTGSPSGGQPH